MPDAVTRLNAALEGRYAIERELGEGGMATVYLADDLLQQEWWYGVSADGQRILLPPPNPDAPAREIHVVTNWFEHLKAMEGN